MSSNSIVLSYDDCLLRQSDLQLLTGPYWLNDNLISFYFEYLKNHHNDAKHLLFVSPEVTQCIKMIPNDQIELFLDPLHATSKKYLFFALNDNNQPQSIGGSHWSLLIFSVPERIAYHFDSSNSTNTDIAESFAKKLFAYFHLKGHFVDFLCLQQTNCYDCGIHLLCNCEYLAEMLIKNDREAVKPLNMKSEILADSVRNMRKKLLDLITKLQKDYK